MSSLYLARLTPQPEKAEADLKAALAAAGGSVSFVRNPIRPEPLHAKQLYRHRTPRVPCRGGGSGRTRATSPCARELQSIETGVRSPSSEGTGEVQPHRGRSVRQAMTAGQNLNDVA